MKISSKVRYGLRTMIEIAASTDSDGILQKDIAKNQNISNKYLDPIISALKLKDLISNSKGKWLYFNPYARKNQYTRYIHCFRTD